MSATAKDTQSSAASPANVDSGRKPSVEELARLQLNPVSGLRQMYCVGVVARCTSGRGDQRRLFTPGGLAVCVAGSRPQAHHVPDPDRVPGTTGIIGRQYQCWGPVCVKGKICVS